MPKHRSMRRIALRLVLTVLVLCGATIGLAHAYLHFRAHRAKQFLAALGNVKIGDSEDSIRPLVQQYGLHRWNPDQLQGLGPRENWIDPWAYDYAVRSLSDHAYGVQIHPWWYPTWAPWSFDQRGRCERALRTTISVIPARIRALFGMRDWNVSVDIRIRNGSVSNVRAISEIEGRSGWHMHEWTLYAEMPEQELQSLSYVASTSAWTGPPTHGGVLLNYLTPKASPEQVRAAHGLNTSCFTSLLGCKGSCEVSPGTVQYLYHHPDAEWGIAKVATEDWALSCY